MTRHMQWRSLDTAWRGADETRLPASPELASPSPVYNSIGTASGTLYLDALAVRPSPRSASPSPACDVTADMWSCDHHKCGCHRVSLTV